MGTADAMNKILANACPSNVLEDGWMLFYIETHCVAWWVEARCEEITQEDPDNPVYNYEIRKMTVESV